MNSKIHRITETAVMLALLICLQWVGGMIPDPMTKQLITGTMVNCVLAVTVLYVGRSGGISVALISPVFAFLLHIAPVFTAVPLIMAGNVCYVLILNLLLGETAKPFWRYPVALTAASITKFTVLYMIGVKLVGGIMFDSLVGKTFLGNVLMDQTILKQLMAMFAWPQLATAVSGGILALIIVPVLRKALKKQKMGD